MKIRSYLDKDDYLDKSEQSLNSFQILNLWQLRWLFEDYIKETELEQG